MNIIVCIKQVPETTEVRINPETNTLILDGVKSIINPIDMYAIEEGVRLKERFGGKSFAEGQVELSLRRDREKRRVPVADGAAELRRLLEALA